MDRLETNALVHVIFGCAEACAGVNCGQNSFCTNGRCECEDGYTGEPCEPPTPSPSRRIHHHPCMDLVGPSGGDPDGVIDINDLLTLMGVFGRPCWACHQSISIPEPQCHANCQPLVHIYDGLPRVTNTVGIADLLFMLEDFGRDNLSAGCSDPVFGETSEFLNPVVTEWASSISGYSTYRLSVALHGIARSLYSIEGTRAGAMQLPAAYQEGTPFGVDTGGTDPRFVALHPNAEYDSWLTVGITDGDSGRLSTIGIDFGAWTESTSLRITNGAVFWMDPNVAPERSTGEVVVAQITVPAGSTGRVTMGMQGHSTQGEDWDVHQVVFMYPP
eukprot:COSAG02_NODE_5457_length_4302_cov_2.364977_7_plen_331_part_00